MEVSRDAVHLKGIGVPDDATTSDTRDATETTKSEPRTTIFKIITSS